jgi:hypothetical protein
MDTPSDPQPDVAQHADPHVMRNISERIAKQGLPG